jgi:hypothetical protein
MWSIVVGILFLVWGAYNAHLYRTRQSVPQALWQYPRDPALAAIVGIVVGLAAVVLGIWLLSHAMPA